MSTLSKRSTPRQDMVLRMIEGACRNTAHAHPGWILDDKLARSIAKRAAGTLTSQWGLVLAAPQARSEGQAVKGAHGLPAGDSQTVSVSGRRAANTLYSRSGVASRVTWRDPLLLLHRALGYSIRDALRDNNPARADALRDVARCVGPLARAETPPTDHRTIFIEGGKP